ncbi:MAG: hypothetical protein RIS29_3107 [Bacteroidota bacterium]|jgi:enterochelin esterase-like enzyme
MFSVKLAPLFLFLSISTAFGQLPTLARGKVVRIENFNSRYVSSRNVDVWLPPHYHPKQKYAVLYMHDGQMLYDANLTWNHQAWRVDSIASRLMEKNVTRPFIVVGIWNGGTTRHTDYFPQKPFESLTPTQRDTVCNQLQRSGRSIDRFQPQSDNYLRFLVEELKPYIDAHFATYRQPSSTFIAGSSMGGLISMYAVCEYPKVFGGAACLSTHWPGTFTLSHNPMPEAFRQYLRTHIPAARTHRFYFDCGDQTLDALYPEVQKSVDSLFIHRGYDRKHFQSRFFPGENHSENAWKKRLDIPLEFLFRKK